MATSERVGHFIGYSEIALAADEIKNNEFLDMAVVHDAVPEFKKLQKWVKKSIKKVGPRPNAHSRKLLNDNAPGALDALSVIATGTCASLDLSPSTLDEICYIKNSYIYPHFDTITWPEGRTPIGVMGSLGVLSATHFYADKSIPAPPNEGPRPKLPDMEDLRTKVFQRPNDLVLITAYPSPTVHAVGLESPDRRSLLLGYSAIVSHS